MKHARTDAQVTRRQAIKRMSALGAGAAAVTAGGPRVFAQPESSHDALVLGRSQPAQRRGSTSGHQYMREENPNVKAGRCQWFTFADLRQEGLGRLRDGTAPERGFVTGDWLIADVGSPNLIAPLDVKLLGYSSLDAFRKDHADAFVAGAMKDGQAYGYPLWFYASALPQHQSSSKEVGSTRQGSAQDVDGAGEVAKRLTIKQGNKFTRQGFKFAMTRAGTMIQFKFPSSPRSAGSVRRERAVHDQQRGRG